MADRLKENMSKSTYLRKSGRVVAHARTGPEKSENMAANNNSDFQIFVFRFVFQSFVFSCFSDFQNFGAKNIKKIT